MEVRRAARNALLKINKDWAKSKGAHEAIPDLLDALFATRQELRREAATWLGEMGADASQAVTALVKLLADRELAVRLAAGNALDKIDSNWVRSRAAGRAVPGLVNLLADPNEGVRKEAAITLGRIGPGASGAIRSLIHLYRSDQSVAVRNEALKALNLIDRNWRSALRD
jgi:HEAT repeat protein